MDDLPAFGHLHGLIRQQRWVEARECFDVHRNDFVSLQPGDKAFLLNASYWYTNPATGVIKWECNSGVIDRMLSLNGPVLLPGLSAALEDDISFDPHNGLTQEEIEERERHKLRTLQKLIVQMHKFGCSLNGNVSMEPPHTLIGAMPAHEGILFYLVIPKLTATTKETLRLLLNLYRPRINRGDKRPGSVAVDLVSAVNGAIRQLQVDLIEVLCHLSYLDPRSTMQRAPGSSEQVTRLKYVALQMADHPENESLHRIYAILREVFMSLERRRNPQDAY